MYSDQERLILGSIVVVYFLFLFGISLFINRNIKTYDDYNVAGRTVSIFPLILTFVGTAIGGATLLGYMGNGFSLGMGEQWLNLGTLIAGVILAFFLVKKIRQLGEKYNMVTIGDFTALRYGEKARIPTVLSVLVAYCAISGMQFVAIATILNLTLGLSMTVGIVISWFLLSLKTFFGGMKSVIWQDAFHGTLQTLGVFVLFIVVFMISGGWGDISENAALAGNASDLSIFNISLSEFFIYLFTIGAYQFVRQDLWQRFWAAKDSKTAVSGYWFSIVLAFLTGAVVILVGVAGRYGLNMESVNPAMVYYGIIGNVFPFFIVVLMIVVLLATVISTADSFLMAASSSIVNDIIKPRAKRADDKKLLSYSRFSVFFVSVLALFLALSIPELVNLWVTGTAMLVSGLLAPVLFGLFWKRATPQAGVLAMWIGLSIAVIWQIFGHPFGLHPVFIGLPLSIITLVTASFASTETKKNYLLEIEFSKVND